MAQAQAQTEERALDRAHAQAIEDDIERDANAITEGALSSFERVELILEHGTRDEVLELKEDPDKLEEIFWDVWYRFRQGVH